MVEIKDKDGNVIRRSDNLRGIRQYVSNHWIDVLAISGTEHGEGELSILFGENGKGSIHDRATCKTGFASFQVLRNFVRRWRNVYGAKLMVNGVDAGKVSFDNPALVGATLEQMMQTGVTNA